MPVTLPQFRPGTHYFARRGVIRVPPMQMAMIQPGLSLLRVTGNGHCQLAKFANLKWQRAASTGNPLPANTLVPGGRRGPLAPGRRA